MGLLDKLFGKKSVSPPALPPRPAPSPKCAAADPSKDPNLIRVFDKYGRELFITRHEWRTNVLPGSIKSSWNDPEQLYGVILNSLNDGFRSDVVEAARQLYKIDTVPVRGACVWGIVLMEEGRLDEAEKVFRDFTATHGEDGSILTNLAKVYAKRKDEAKAEEILWHALEVDPNQDNGFAWYEAMHRERGGDEAGLAAMRRVAALPGSWRAQLWLARAALKSRDLEKALALYRESLSRVAKPIPGDLLKQISGDLGNTGHLPEILELVEPHFDTHLHGLPVGNNLIKAHLDLGQIEAARRILDQLFAFQRLDWKENLSYWDTEIAKAKVAASPLDPQAGLKMAMLTIAGPVWLKPDSPAAELFPAKPADVLVVSFLGGSAEVATNSQRVEHQLADATGRMSRALPLFLAEQVEFGSHARTQTLVPWIVEPTGGFVLSGGAWSDEDAANHSRQGEIKSDYVVISHLKTKADPWSAEVRLVRTIDGQCLGQLSESFSMAAPTDAIRRLASQVLESLARAAEVEPQPLPPFYTVPAGANFPAYLLRLEQLLAVRCSAMDGVQSGFLSGEREIIDGNLQQCVAIPGSVSTRILLAQTLLTMKRVRPDILPEFKDKLDLLQKEHPLPPPADGVVQRLFNEVLAA